MKALMGFVFGVAASTAPLAHAEVTATADNGFVVHHQVSVAVDPETAYAMVRSPAKWWSPEHSWTGKAENFYMDAQAGGCFCELIPAAGDGRERTLRGSVQHMRILYADPGKALRLSGALGPLQSEALTGTMTMLFKPVPGGTAISFDYIVGGYMRFAVSDVSPAVDAVIGEQALRLARVLGPLGDESQNANAPEEGGGADIIQPDADPSANDSEEPGNEGPAGGSLAEAVAGLGHKDDGAMSGPGTGAPPER